MKKISLTGLIKFQLQEENVLGKITNLTNLLESFFRKLKNTPNLHIVNVRSCRVVQHDKGKKNSFIIKY